ncbi:hypothetical protein [Wolbachia endosymbiont of Laodelphax striatellus]|uniref:hypothetical protein n=2 Tax=Wolbachia endosymbiont of Laodelphax striatellus TaxID=368602 RepID=UPI00117EACAC|nr:hypothetical protein [Wolbachia endosymbiont of Laodelphax striatellus]
MTRYSISQPYNVYSHNTDVPCSSDSKSACIFDKSEDKSCLDKDCTAVYKFCLIGDHHIPNLHIPFKHNHIPCQDNHHSHLNHYHHPCHSSHEAAWYHAHDSGNTVVVNIPPYHLGTGTGTGTGIGTGAGVETEFGTHEVVKTGEASLDLF